jgi:hypothetical protein
MFGHKLGGAGAAAVLVFFFAPWVLFSCGAQPVGEYSGYALASGQWIAGLPDSGKINPNENIFTMLFWVPVCAGAVAVVAGFALLKQSAFLARVIDGLIMVVLAGAALYITYDRMQATEKTLIGSMVLAQWQYGLYMTMAGLVCILLGGALALMQEE